MPNVVSMVFSGQERHLARRGEQIVIVIGDDSLARLGEVDAVHEKVGLRSVFQWRYPCVGTRCGGWRTENAVPRCKSRSQGRQAGIGSRTDCIRIMGDSERSGVLFDSGYNRSGICWNKLNTVGREIAPSRAKKCFVRMLIRWDQAQVSNIH